MKNFDSRLLLEAVELSLPSQRQASSSKLLILCECPIKVGNIAAIGLYEIPKDSKWDMVVAVDLLDDAEDPSTLMHNLRELLSPEGELLMVQPNRALFRGVVPAEAGGTRRSLSYYAFRSLLCRADPSARFAVVNLDGELAMEPLPDGHASSGATPADSLAFLAAIGAGDNFPVASRRVDGLTVLFDKLRVVSPSISSGAVRSIAFVIDVHDWAYANIVNQIEAGLAGRYNIERFFLVDYEDKSELIADLFVRNRFDNIHFMWREFLFNSLDNKSALLKVMKQEQVSSESFADLIARPVITTTIYDHLFLEPDSVAKRQSALALADGYSTSSGMLDKIYRSMFSVAPLVETPDGVNTKFFLEKRHQDSGSDLPFRVGWVGNSDWGKQSEAMGEDPKGLHSILIPAVGILQQEGRQVVLELADRNIRRRDRSEMREYYASEIDVLVCSSRFEGTPNPVLEAMASGCPIVSTDVGIVREVCGLRQAEFILPERSIPAMADALRRMMDNPELRRELARENRKQSELFDWGKRIDYWTTLFARAEARHCQGGRLLRAEVMLGRLESYRLEQQRSASADPAAIERLRRRVATLTENNKKASQRIASLAQVNLTLRNAIIGSSEAADSKQGNTATEYARLVAENQRLEDLVHELENRPVSDELAGASRRRIVELEAHNEDLGSWNEQLQTRLAEVEAWAQEMQVLLNRRDPVAAIVRRVVSSIKRGA